MSGFSLYRSEMRLSAQAEAALPVAAAFAGTTDFSRHEMRAARAGVAVEKLVPSLEGAVRSWRLRGTWRGRERTARLGLMENRTQESLTFLGRSERFEVQIRVLFFARGPKATQMRLDVAISPRTVTGRLAMPGLKLARGRLKARLGAALARYVRQLEADYAAPEALKGAAG